MASAFEGPDLGPKFARTTAPFIAVSTIAIALRFWSRSLVQEGRKFWWDDWMCLFAWFIGITLSSIGLVWVDYGLGKHQDQVSFDDEIIAFKLTWVSYLLFISGVGTIKLCALFFYQRVFGPAKFFRHLIYGVHALVATWTVAFVLTCIFNCIPVQKFWTPELEGSCVQLAPFYLACSICDVILDVIVLVLPLPMVWNLHRSWSQKASITFAFICAYLALVPSLGRMASTVQQGAKISVDFPYNAIDDLMWSYIEIPIGIVSLCIPSWLTLVKRWQQHGFGALFTTHLSASRAYDDATLESRAASRAARRAELVSDDFDDDFDDDEKLAGAASRASVHGSDTILVKKEIHIRHERLPEEF